jgi:hypothetical protein
VIESERINATVSLERPLNQLREQRFPLVHLELEGARHDWPRSREQVERGRKTEEKQPSLTAGARIVAVAEGRCKLFERCSQWRRQRLDGHCAAVSQVPQEEAGGCVIQLHVIKKPAERVEHADRLSFAGIGFGCRSHVGETGCGPTKDRPVELPLASEVIGDRSWVGAGEITDIAHRSSPVSVIGKEAGGRLQEAFSGR